MDCNRHYFYGSRTRCMEDTMKIRKHVLGRVTRFTLVLVLAMMVSVISLWAEEVGSPDQCSAPTVGVGTGIVGSANGSATCGILITVTGPGMAVITSPGNGN